MLTPGLARKDVAHRQAGARQEAIRGGKQRERRPSAKRYVGSPKKGPRTEQGESVNALGINCARRYSKIQYVLCPITTLYFATLQRCR